MERQDATTLEGRLGLAELLRSRREEILADWLRAVRRLPSARELSDPVLVDHVPQLLDAIAEELLAAGDAEAPAGAADHALVRLREGFDLAEVIADYTLLRDVIHARREAERPVGDGLRRLDQIVDAAIAAAAREYLRARDRVLQALDRIAAVPVEATSLDDLLVRLLRAMMETSLAVDTARIFLRDGDVLRARAAVGLEEDVSRGLTLRFGEGFAGRVAEARRPLLSRSAATDPRVLSPVIRARGVKALYGVPLLGADDLIGVAEMGSLTVHEFSEEDQQLFQIATERAAAAIAQHVLAEAAQRRAQEVAASEARLRSILASAGEGIIGVDQRGRVTLLNDAAARMLGWSAEELIGRDAHQAYHHTRPDGRVYPFEECPLVASIRSGVAIRVDDDLFWRRDGEGFPVAYTVSPIREDAKVVGAVAVFEDTTTQRRARAAQTFLGRTMRALSESIELEATLLRLARACVPDLADLCAVVALVEGGPGRAAAHASDRALAEAAGDPAELARVPAVARVLGGSGPSLVADATRGDDVLARLGLHSVLAVPLFADERTVGALALALAAPGRRFGDGDVALAEELGRRAGYAVDNARLYEEARQAVRTRDEVLAIVSHDLKNPLATVLLNAQLLRRTAGEDERVAQRSESIRRAGERMDRLIRDLLDLSSIRARTLSLERRPHAAGELAREAVEAMRALAASHRVELSAEVAADAPVVAGDRERILQVFSNLIGNALRATPAGGSIRVRAGTARDGAALFAVSDSGRGIPRDELERLFEPWRRGATPGYRGTGLGLYIARGIVEAHGGRICADSRPGAGSSFYFTIPLAKERV